MTNKMALTQNESVVYPKDTAYSDGMEISGTFYMRTKGKETYITIKPFFAQLWFAFFLGHFMPDVLVFIGDDKNIEIILESGTVCGPSQHGLPPLDTTYSLVDQNEHALFEPIFTFHQTRLSHRPSLLLMVMS